MGKPKIILFDLETIPNLREALKVWPQLSAYPGRTMKATITTIACAGWKELGSKKTHCIKAWDFPQWEKDINDDSQVTKAIREVIAGADAVITHNGKKFDWKFLQTRILKHKLDPLAKINHIDTVAEARRNMFNFSNRLGEIGKFLLDEDKMDHEGWELWVKVCERNKTAMHTMARYCKQDVDLLEKVFLQLRPFISNIPNYNLFRLVDIVCPSCGSQDIVKHGWKVTKAKKYRRMQCKDCGSISRLNLDETLPRSM